MGYIDLHIHTTFSDGTMTPAEIVSDAAARGMDMIAICDHNVVEGSLQAQKIADAAGLKLIPGVEIDAMMSGEDAHILCYGADLTNEGLLKVVRHARARLDWMSDELFVRMLPDFPSFSEEEFASFEYDCRKGGWKLYQYMIGKGIENPFAPYDKYGVTYASAGFAPAEEVVAAIHAAGGAAVLAHPGVTFKAGALEAARQALKMGVDGVECFYPKHSGALTDALVRFCDENALLVTAGSDCHGAFGSAHIGQTQTTGEQLRLKHRIFM